jgi:PEP-CTERM motif
MASSLASADSILTPIQTQSSGLQQANDTTTSLTFNKWDPTLFPGFTLTGVHFTLAGHEETAYTVTDNSNSPNSYTFLNNLTVVLANGSTIFDTVLPAVTASGTITANGSTTSPGFPARNLTSDVTGTDVSFTDAPTLALFFGSGTIALQTSAHSTNGFTAAGDVSSGVITRFSDIATVQFEYVATPTSGVPEPTTMALMGGAMIGLGLLGKRLKKS